MEEIPYGFLESGVVVDFYTLEETEKLETEKLETEKRFYFFSSNNMHFITLFLQRTTCPPNCLPVWSGKKRILEIVVTLEKRYGKKETLTREYNMWVSLKNLARNSVFFFTLQFSSFFSVGNFPLHLPGAVKRGLEKCSVHTLNVSFLPSFPHDISD